jgi:hypothetical protein
MSSRNCAITERGKCFPPLPLELLELNAFRSAPLDGRFARLPVRFRRGLRSFCNLAIGAISIWSSRACSRDCGKAPLPAAGRFGRAGSGSPRSGGSRDFSEFTAHSSRTSGSARNPWLASIQQRPEDPRLCYRKIAPNLLNGHSVPLATSRVLTEQTAGPPSRRWSTQTR